MIILHWSLLLILVLIVPYIIGTLLVTHMDKSYQSPAMDYLCGWFTCFAIFEIIAVPFILLEKSFTLVVIVYSIVICALLVYTLIYKNKTISNVFTRFKFSCFKFDKLTNFIWTLFIILMIAQAVTMALTVFYDGDDLYFIPIADMANSMDIMYTRDAYTGYVSELDMRHAMSPTPLYYAWLARATGMHVSTVAHVVFGPIMLVLMYATYSNLAKRLFKKQEKARPWFLLLLVIWYTFGNISSYTVETFAMNRMWQGKAILGNIVLPAILWCLIMLGDKKQAKGTWILLFISSIVAVFCTSVSFMLVPTVIGAGAFVQGVRKRSFKYFLKICACMIPCLIFAGMYLVCK